MVAHQATASRNALTSPNDFFEACDSSAVIIESCPCVNQRGVDIKDVQWCVGRTTRSPRMSINYVFTAAAAAKSLRGVKVAVAVCQCVADAMLRQVARSALDDGWRY